MRKGTSAVQNTGYNGRSSAMGVVSEDRDNGASAIVLSHFVKLSC